MAGSDTFSGLRVTEPSLDAALHPADLKNDRFPSDRPSLRKRAARPRPLPDHGFHRRRCHLAWQSYGEATKQMLARQAPQLGWLLSLATTNSLPHPEIVAGQPSPPGFQASVPGAPQAAPVAQTAPDMIASTAPAAPFSRPAAARGDSARSRCRASKR